jgi:hypothetical protein
VLEAAPAASADAAHDGGVLEAAEPMPPASQSDSGPDGPLEEPKAEPLAAEAPE